MEPPNRAPNIVLHQTKTKSYGPIYEYMVKNDDMIVGGFTIKIEFDDKVELLVENIYISRLIDYQMFFRNIIEYLNINFKVANYVFDRIIYYGYIRSYFTFPKMWRLKSTDLNDDLESMLTKFIIDPSALNDNSLLNIDFVYDDDPSFYCYINSPNHEYVDELGNGFSHLEHDSSEESDSKCEDDNNCNVDPAATLLKIYFPFDVDIHQTSSSSSDDIYQMENKSIGNDHNVGELTIQNKKVIGSRCISDDSGKHRSTLIHLILLSPQYTNDIYDKTLYIGVIEFIYNLSSCMLSRDRPSHRSLFGKCINGFILSRPCIPKTKLKTADNEIEITLYTHKNSFCYAEILHPRRSDVTIIEKAGNTSEYKSIKFKRHFQLFRNKLSNADTKKNYFVIGVLFDEPLKILGTDGIRSEDIEFTLNIGPKFYTKDEPCFNYRLNKIWKQPPCSEMMLDNTMYSPGISLIEMNIIGFFTPETDDDYSKFLDERNYRWRSNIIRENKNRGITRGYYDYPQLIDMMNSIHRDFHGFSKCKVLKKIPEYIYSGYVIPKSLIPKQQVSPSSTTEQQTSDLGYIYILHEREFINSDQPVYKIGMSNDAKIRADSLPSRSGGYPKNSRYLYLHDVGVDNSKNLETIIKKVLAGRFKLRADIGSEYFEGDKYKIIECVSKICNGINL